MSYLVKDDTQTPALPVDLKYENRNKILREFRYGQACTVADVSAATGISKLTVMRAIQFFCQKGVLASVGRGQSSDLGGKKPEIFAFSDKRHVLCISLWPLRIQLSLASLTGNSIAKADFPADLHRALADAFSDLRQSVLGFLKQENLEPDDLYGVVLSTSGTVDYHSGHLKYSSNSPEWGRDIPIFRYLKDIVGDHAVLLLENAGKTTGRAVLQSNVSLQTCRVLTLFTSWGISACMLQNGRPLNGKDSLIGEIGHMTIDPTDEDVCGCGMRGCLERLVSLERLSKMLRQSPPKPDSPLARLGVEQLNFHALFSASAEGDECARRLVNYLSRCFASALHNISLVYNPEYVIFQGDMGLADSYFDTQLKATLESFKYYPNGGAFRTIYDSSDLYELDARGGWFMLNEHYFHTQQLYIDS